MNDERRRISPAANDYSEGSQPGGNDGYRPGPDEGQGYGPGPEGGSYIPPTPETIEQLQAWYVAHNLPPEEVTRFFIGKNVMEPRAFGIYRDGNLFIVYKNKNDGSRAIRYSGPDEKFAVNELYQKLKQEIANQKGNNASRRSAAQLTPEERRKQTIRNIILAVLIVAFIAGFFWLSRDKHKTGYYHAGDDWYYYYGGAWYYYDDYGWQPYNSTYDDAYWDDHYYSGDYVPATGVTNFEQTEYYSNTDTDSSWSSSDTWDSGTTDFSSDW